MAQWWGGRKSATVETDKEPNVCNLRTQKNPRNCMHVDLCVCIACGPRPSPQSRGGGRRLALKGWEGGGGAENRMHGNARKTGGRTGARRTGKSPPGGNSEMSSVKRALDSDLRGAEDAGQGSHPAKRNTADGLCVKEAMDTGADRALQTAAVSAAASGDAGAASVEQPAVTDTEMAVGTQQTPQAESEGTPAPELSVASGRKTTPGEQAVETAESPLEAEEQRSEQDPTEVWEGVMRGDPDFRYRHVTKGMRSTVRVSHTAALGFYADAGRRPKASIPLKVCSPPRPSSPVSPNTLWNFKTSVRVDDPDDTEEQRVQEMKDWYCHVAQKLGLKLWSKLNPEQKTRLLESAQYRRLPDERLLEDMSPAALVHAYAVANGLDEPGLELEVLAKLTSRPDDAKQELTMQQHNIPNAQGALFKNGHLDVEHAPVLKALLKGNRVGSKEVSDGIHRALFNLDFTLVECWAPKANDMRAVQIGVQIIPAREEWRMTIVLLTVEGPHRAHVVNTLLLLSVLGAIEVDDMKTDDRYTLDLRLAGIPLSFEQLETAKESGAWKVIGVLGLSQQQAYDVGIKGLFQHLIEMGLSHTSIEYCLEYIGTMKSKDSRGHLSFLIYVTSGAHLMPKDGETIFVDMGDGPLAIQYQKQAAGQSEYRRLVTCRLDVYFVRGHANFPDGQAACQRTAQTREGREFLTNAIQAKTGVKPNLMDGPDGFILSQKTNEDGKRFWNLHLTEESMAELAAVVQQHLVENQNGKVTARLRVVGVQNVFGLNQVLDLVMSKQTLEHWTRSQRQGGGMTATAAVRGARGGQAALVVGGAAGASVKSMLETVMDTKLRDMKGEVERMLRPLQETSTNAMHTMTAVKRDVNEGNKTLLSKATEVNTALKGVQAGMDTVVANTDKLKNFDTLVNAFADTTRALQAFASNQGPAQLPPPAPAPAPPPPLLPPGGLVGAAEFKAYMEFLASRQVTPRLPHACSISAVCMPGLRPDGCMDGCGSEWELRAEHTGRVVMQGRDHTGHRAERRSKAESDPEAGTPRSSGRRAQTGPQQRSSEEWPKYEVLTLDRAPDDRGVVYGGGPIGERTERMPRHDTGADTEWLGEGEVTDAMWRYAGIPANWGRYQLGAVRRMDEYPALKEGARGRRLVFCEGKTIAPFVGGGHFRIILGIGSENGGTLWLFDSLGLHRQFREVAGEALKSSYPNHELVDLRHTPQNDSHACGTWVVWAAQAMAAYKPEEGPFPSYFERRARGQGVTPYPTVGNGRFIADLKRGLRELGIRRSRAAPMVPDTSIQGGESRERPVQLEDAPSEVDPQSGLATPWGGRAPAPGDMSVGPVTLPRERGTHSQDPPAAASRSRGSGDRTRRRFHMIVDSEDEWEEEEGRPERPTKQARDGTEAHRQRGVAVRKPAKRVWEERQPSDTDARGRDRSRGHSRGRSRSRTREPDGGLRRAESGETSREARATRRRSGQRAVGGQGEREARDERADHPEGDIEAARVPEYVVGSMDVRPVRRLMPPRLGLSHVETTAGQRKAKRKTREPDREGGLHRFFAPTRAPRGETEMPGRAGREDPPPPPTIEGTNPPREWTTVGPAQEMWTLVSWNVKGLGREHDIAGDTTELHALVGQCDPAIICLQETWTKRGAKWRKPAALKNYHVFRSSTLKTADDAPGRHKGGVLTAVASWLRPASMAEHIRVEERFQGYILPVLLDTGPSRTLIVNVYAPPITGTTLEHTTAVNTDSRLGRTQQRVAILQEVRRIMEEQGRRWPGMVTIMGGDMNATLVRTDRGTEYRTDREYRQWVRDAGLTACGPLEDRAHTFYPSEERLAAGVSSGRIDDWLISREALGMEPRDEAGAGVIHMAHRSDHEPLAIDIRPVGYTPPGSPPKQAPIRRIVAPFTPEHKANLLEALEDCSQDGVQELLRLVSALAHEGGEVGREDSTGLEAVTKQLAGVLNTALEKTMDTVGENISTGEGIKERPEQRGHMNTTLKAKYDGARTKRDKAEAALRQLRRTSQDSLDSGAHPQALTEYYMRYPSLRERVGEVEGIQMDIWMEALAKEVAKAKAEMRTLTSQHDRARSRKQHAKAEHELRYNAKKAHRNIFGSNDNRKTLTAVRTRGGGLDTTAEAVLEATATHFEGTSVRRVDDSACDRVPWESARGNEAQSTTDHIQLPSARDKVAGDFKIGHLYNRGMYDQALATLPGKKAPGIDGVPNEVLKHMPEGFHDAMHNLFKVLWERHRTPTAWKQALTVLLYKKDDPHEVKNYRPIGLLTAVYKLWSAVITRCLSAFVEEHDMLSGAQEGFRANRNTVRQLQRLTMMMEDSKLSDRPLYVLYVDFVNAFGSVDHKLLTDTMARQHYPQDIIDIIEDLYNESVMRVRTPLGVTRELRNLGRGTVQGDPLSPLLFIIAIDPLLRWLQAGNKGYKMNTSSSEIAALAYADDLAVTAGSVAHLRDQARKIEAFCAWAGLEVNVDRQRKNKTAWTGPTQTIRSDGALMLLGQEIPRLKDVEPYVYLGLHVSLNLKWRKHAAALTRKVQQKLEAISKMPHSPELVMRTLESVVRPTIRYTMPVGVMGWGTVGKLNSKFTTAAKDVVGLSRHSSNWTVMRDRLQAGLGVDPLHLTYMVATLSEVQELQTSTEDLGDMWRGLWSAHADRIAPGGRIPHFEGYREAYPVRNVMAQMQDLGITLGPECPQGRPEGTNTLYGLARTLKEAGVKNTSCIKPLLEAGVQLTQELQRAGDGRIMNLHEFKRSDTCFSRTGPNQGRALRQLAELLHTHPEIELPPPKKGPLEACEGWGGTAGPIPAAPDTGTALTVTIGQPGRKRFARTGRQDIRPTRIIPLRQAAEGDETLRVAEIRAKEYRAEYGEEEDGGAAGGWHYEVRFEGREDWEWVRGSNMDSDPKQRDEDIKLYRLSRRPPPPVAGQKLAPLHGHRVAVLLHPCMPDVTEDLACGICGSKEDARGNDILKCDGCDCAVHQLCHAPRVVTVPAGGWVCNACEALDIAPAPEPPRAWGTLQTTSKADEVEFDPDTYPYVILFDDGTLDSIYTDGESKHRVRGQEADDTRRAFIQEEIVVHPPAHAGTEKEDTSTGRDREIQQVLQRKIEAGDLRMAVEPADPYRDTKPTGSYTLRRSQGAVPCMEGQYRARKGDRERQVPAVPGAAVVHSHAPNGTWLGVMTEARYEFLERKWREYWADPRRGERGGGDIQWRPLEREIADLFRRYRPGAKKGDGSKVNLQNHWAVRDPLRCTIVRGYKVTHECFASPLNCLLDEDAPEWYCSAHQRDVVFGARYDAYAQWPSGRSMYMNPEYTKEDIKKALRWAIAASQMEDPFSAVLVIPRFLMASYMDLLSHHNVHLVAKAERDTFSFMAPTHWEVGDRDPEGRNTAKWQVMVVEVANPEGRELLKTPDAEDNIREEICRSGAQLVVRADPAFADATAPYAIPAPKEMTQLRRRAKRAARWPTPDEPPVQCETHALLDMRPEELAARDPRAGRIIFTDGSKIQDEVGAGYVIPVRPWHPEHFESTDGLLFPGRMMKVAGPQTVNRAEMTAILAALQDVGDGADCSIYTDSKVSIQNIKRWAADPNLLNRDKHEDVLRDIAHRLAARTGHTRILKIMAHKGHPGNEAADRIAKMAAETGEGVSNERRGTYETGRATAKTLYMEGECLTDLKKQLRPRMQQWAAEQGKLQTATHLQWTCADEDRGTDPSDVDPKPSNVHWRKGRTKPKSVIKHVFRMRGNDYMCNYTKWLHAPEAKKPETSKHCPYGCKHGATGELLPDTWIHTFLCKGSGAADMTTARHNAACRIIERAIKQGDKARATLLRNYGRQDEAPEEETVPAWLLPPEYRGTGSLANSPDFMIVDGLNRHEPRPLGPLQNHFYHGDQQISYKLTIGEVKYTHDLKMPLAHARARDKYQGGPSKLADKLRDAGWKVTGVYTIVIGHRACVSAQNKEAFEGLGIKGKKAQADLQEKLAESAAEWARSIVGHTRKARARLSATTSGRTRRR